METKYAVAEYLRSLKDSNAGQSEAIDSVIQLLADDTAESYKEFSYSTALDEIVKAGTKSLELLPFRERYDSVINDSKFMSFFDVVKQKGFFEGTEEDSIEYLQRYAKLIKKYQEKGAMKGPSSQAEDEAQAESFKTEGNKAINSKNYQDAEDFYTKALELSCAGPNSHIYYSNRAAAYCHLGRYQDSVEDCLLSLALSPDYVKAHSRLGLSYFFLEQYQDAVNAYQCAVDLEPGNKASQDSLTQAKNKLRKSQRVVPPSDAPSQADLSGMMNNPALKSAMDKAGLANLMSNPQMMSMAQQMMQDPAMMQQAMSMLGMGGAGGGPGGMDLSALQSMMGGGGVAPSSSSAKKPFAGFED